MLLEINKSKCIYLLLIMLIPFCMIDAVNGFFLLNGKGVPLSLAYKAFLLLFIFVCISKTTYLYLILSLMIGVILYQTIFYSSDFFFDLSVFFKSAIFVFLLVFFIIYNGHLTLNHFNLIEMIFLLNYIVVVLNVYLGIFNIGFTTYGEGSVASGSGAGYKGFFYAGNELGALLVCLYPMVNIIIKERYSAKISLLADLNFLIAGFLIGTKSAFLGIAILVFYNLARSNVSFVKKVSAIFLSLAIFNFVLLVFSEHVGVFVNKFEFALNQKGWLYLLLSGRDEFVYAITDYVILNFGVADYFFGMGMSAANLYFKSAEIDFIDLWVWHGLLWMLIVYAFFFYLFIRFFLILDLNRRKIFILTFVLLLFISVFAGHMLTSAMLLPFLSLYLPYSTKFYKYPHAND